jgi:hypothetical protein
MLLFVATITLAGGRLRWWLAGRLARNAVVSTGLSHREEMLRDVGKVRQAKRCWMDWKESLHSRQAEPGELPIIAE